MSKRLAAKNTFPADAQFESNDDNSTSLQKLEIKNTGVKNVPAQPELKKSGTTASEYNLYIVPYTEKSIVVMGDTLDHSNALVRLGGSFNTGLKVGTGWVFAKMREESVKKYIQTGEIVPYVYKKDPQGDSLLDKRKLVTEIFTTLRNAFDTNEDYTGESIHDVLNQIEKMNM